MILVLFLALAANSLTCTTQRCGKTTAGYCYEYYAANTTGVSTKCEKDFACSFDFSSYTKNFLCVPNTDYVEYSRLPGQYCDDDKFCILGTTCKSGKCVGLSLNAACTSTDLCQPGLYCATGTNTCQTLKAAAATCGAGDVCTYGYSCYQGTCQKLYSIAPEAAIDVSSCVFGSSDMCQNVSCLVDTTANTAKCIAPYKIQGTYGICDTTCTGVSGTYTIQGACTCGLSGNSYCQSFQGDEYPAKALSLHKTYIFSSDIKKCNINAGMACLEDYGDEDFYYEYLYYHYLAGNLPSIYNSEECVWRAVDTYLAEIIDEIEESSSSSSFGQYLAVSGLVYSLFC